MNTRDIELYVEVKSQLEYYKQMERKLRVDLCEALFPTANDTSVSTFVGDYVVKGIFKNNIKFDADSLAKNAPYLTEEEAECIKYTPRLIASAYKKLDDSSMIDECLVVTPALPTINVTVDEDRING